MPPASQLKSAAAITGAARGIRRAVCRPFADSGVAIVAVDLDAPAPVERPWSPCTPIAGQRSERATCHRWAVPGRAGDGKNV